MKNFETALLIMSIMVAFLLYALVFLALGSARLFWRRSNQLFHLIFDWPTRGAIFGYQIMAGWVLKHYRTDTQMYEWNQGWAHFWQARKARRQLKRQERKLKKAVT